MSEYGNYGGEGVIIFPDYQLTPEQWDELDVLPDNDKMSYVKGIFDENELGYMEFNDWWNVNHTFHLKEWNKKSSYP